MQVLGNIKCGCGCDKVPVTEGKGGALSSKCPDCGAQSFVRSPKAVAAWKSKFTPAAGAPAPGWGDDLLKI